MAKLRTIDAIRTSVQSIKKYIDSKLPRINIKQDVVKAFDVSIDLENPRHPEFVTDTLGLIPNVEYKIIISVDGVQYHGRFTPELYSAGYTGAVNYVEDGVENIFFDGIDDYDDYLNAPRCLGYINLFDKVRFDPDLGEVYDETKAIINFSVGEYEDGTIETITGVEIIVPDEQNVLLTGEVLQQELDKKQDKLIYKETKAVKPYRININGQLGQVMNQCGFVSETLNLVPGSFCTVKIKAYDIPIPQSVDANSEKTKLYNVTKAVVDDTFQDSTCEIDFDKNLIVYRMPVVLLSSQETGYDIDMIMLETQLINNMPAGSIEFSIFDKLTVDETDTPIYSEDKSLFLLTYYGFASTIEYVEIIPDISDTDMVETEVNNEFLETHRFITKEEKQKYETVYNNSQISQSEFDSMVFDLFGFKKEKFVFRGYRFFGFPSGFPSGEPKNARRIYCKIYHTDGSVEEKDMIYNEWGEGEKEYSYDLVVSPDLGTVGVYIDYQQEEQMWYIYMDCGSASDKWPEEIAKVEVIIEL